MQVFGNHNSDDGIKHSKRNSITDEKIDDTIDDNGSSDAEIRYSRRNNKNLAFRKKSSYNEYATLANQWAYNAEREPGETTILYDGRRKKYVLLEAMDDGYSEAAIGSYAKVRGVYEQTYTGTAHEIHEDTNEIRSEQRPSVWDLQLSQDGGNDVGDAGSIGGEGLQGNSAGNDEHLLQGDPGASVEDAPTEQSVKKSVRSEERYTYKALVSKPDMTLTELADKAPGNRADVIKEAKMNAAKIGKCNAKDGSVSVHVNDMDADVVLVANGLKHSLDRRFSINAPVTLQAGAIFKNSIKINELTPQKAEASDSYVFIGAATGSHEELYVVRSVVNKYSNELTSMDVLYAINAKKGIWLRSMRPGFQGPVTSPTISISTLLDFANQYFPDILPEDVLRHYGYTERPAGELGQYALYSTRNKSNRELLSDALETTIDTSTSDGEAEAA